MLNSTIFMKLIYTTVNDYVIAQKFIQNLLQKRLIACGNIFSNVTSIYTWNDEICTDQEFIVILKTTNERVKEAVNELKNIHSYKVPCILEIDIAKVHSDEYLNWVLNSTS